MLLNGRSAVITGANQGLGKSIAQEFLREGASIVICARDRELLERTRAELEQDASPGQKVLAQTCDVSSAEQVAGLVDFALTSLGRIQILVNNAAISGPKGPVESVDWREWTRTLEINLYGVLLPCRALIPHFKAAGYGKIVNLSGGGATAPRPFFTAYAASKAAVVRMTDTLAEELKPFHIDINAMAPGAMNTRLLYECIEAGPEKVGQEAFDKALQQKNNGGVPLEKGARLCAYLASAQSDGITGRLVSAQWDPWSTLHEHKEDLGRTDIYTLRRIIPEDRGRNWAS